MLHPGRDSASADWTRVLSVVEEALGLDPGERRVHVERELADAPELLTEALALLAEDGAPDTRLEPPQGGLLPDLASGEDLPLKRVGPYELKRLLGRGGMGAVYLAAQVEGTVRRQVALKLVPPSLGSDDVVARFHRERQVQANLSHPCIATLLDGGATDDGLPYLVMEYVGGERIDRWCDAKRLGTEERLRLFLKVADAVAHAHESLVVHRDIKPSNILVTERAEPVLLDFGIAKVLDPERLDVEYVTAGGPAPMTPAYASPEQLRGRPVTHSSDLYSLGVLLFQLLTGHLPHELEGRSPAEIERIVCGEEPLRPSRAVLRTRDLSVRERRSATTRLTPEIVSERRGTNPRALSRALAGDLEHIVLMCLRKEPERRYAAVRDLMQDVERFLGGRAIFARPDTLRYRVSRFVRRNRLPVGIAGGIVLALSGALAFSLWQYDRALGANERFREQKGLAEDRLGDLRSFRGAQLDELAPLLAELPGALAASEKLIGINLEYLDREAAHATDDPELMAEVVKAYVILADLQGNPTTSGRGDSRAARETYDKAMTFATRLEAEHPTHEGAAALLGKALVRSANFLVTNGPRDEGIDRLHRAVDLARRRIAEPQGSDPSRMYYLRVDALRFLTYAEIGAGRFEGGREAADRTLESLREMMAAFPDLAFFLEGEVCALQEAAATCERELGRPQAAFDLLVPAEEKMGAILRAHPPGANGMYKLSSLRTSKGLALQALGRFAEAEEELRAALAIVRDIADESEDDMRAGRWLLEQEGNFGGFLVHQGRLEEAAPHLEQAHALASELAVRDPDQRFMQRKLATSELYLGRMTLAVDDLPRAGELLESCRERLESLRETADGDFAVLQPLALSYRSLSELHRARAAGAGGPAAAEQERATALGHLERAANLIESLRARGLGGVDLAGEAALVEEQRAKLLDELNL